jgi:hypothetical protein
MAEKYRRVLEGEPFFSKEVFFPITTGGGEAYYNVQGVPVRSGGKISGALFIIEDVTELKKTQAALKRYSEDLEVLVDARTADLKDAVARLDHENRERRKVEEEREELICQLQEALKQVKLLSGFLPICSSCKRIRDDQGRWMQIESYIRDHSEAEFSHGICPECKERLYPDY